MVSSGLIQLSSTGTSSLASGRRGRSRGKPDGFRGATFLGGAGLLGLGFRMRRCWRDIVWPALASVAARLGAAAMIATWIFRIADGALGGCCQTVASAARWARRRRTPMRRMTAYWMKNRPILLTIP
jgi:hypothetical protein